MLRVDTEFVTPRLLEGVLLNSSAHTVNAGLDVRLALQLHMAFDRVCVVVLLAQTRTLIITQDRA